MTEINEFWQCPDCRCIIGVTDGIEMCQCGEFRNYLEEESN